MKKSSRILYERQSVFEGGPIETYVEILYERKTSLEVHWAIWNIEMNQTYDYELDLPLQLAKFTMYSMSS